MKAGGDSYKLRFKTPEDREEEDATILWVMTAAEETQVKAAIELDGIFISREEQRTAIKVL